ncbi:tumor protein p53-inducible protein 13 [Toxotes jaculatrix]|uniref:tumor protein p53-inducible protein 13 n=1 Tax=Toxotes jaculatrix TaxID=941984 RepID=UPI001B3B1390|nr:tumor protein p53-inducible protein 13 [Toxotes jaculatrix]
MPCQTTSPPLTVTVLAALWVSLGRCGVSESPGPGCDNGKLSLDMDLPADAGYWDCSVSTWPESTQRHPSIDTVYDLEPARQICMDEPISYSHTIPNSGAYRPVRAESGEYLYCPPQRWLSNLHHGATVLLYHPCAPLHERLLLSVLARSCLSDYIVTPHPQLSKHMPVALVSWGRTLELPTVASSDVCDWLETTTTTRNKFRGANHIRKYNLLLTWPAKQHGLQHTHPEERSTEIKESLRQCCEQTVSSLLNEAMGAELESTMKKESLKKMEKGGKSRQIRAAIRETQEDAKDKKERDNTIHAAAYLANHTNKTILRRTLGPSADSPPMNSTLSDHSGPREAQSKIQNLNQSLTPRPVTPLGSNMSTLRSDSSELRSSESQKSWLTVQPATLQLSPKHTDPKNKNPSADVDVLADHNHTARPVAVAFSSKNKGTESAKPGDKDSAKHSIKENSSKEKNYDKVITADGKMKDNEVVDVKERELEHKQTQSATHSHHKSENSGFDSVSKSQSESPPQPQQHPHPQSAIYLPNSQDCDSCKSGKHCDCTKASAAEARAAIVNKGLPRTPRTDEAVWAAAALGFLLILLTLSVLHTRLYRHWRTTPSLYWHDPRQDYDSVADVIRRRLRIAKRRRKRGRRQECVLLPSSSSSDDLP